MANDSYVNIVNAPALHAAVVSPSDSVDLTVPCRGLYVGGAGDVNVITLGGETVLFSAATAGSVLPIRCTRVKSTSTTATLIVALW